MHDHYIFFEDKTDVASLDLVTGLADTVHSVSGDNITVPGLTGRVELIGVYASMEEASDTIVNAQVRTPSMGTSLGVTAGVDLAQMNNPASDTFAQNVPIPYNNLLASPVPLVEGEFMTAYMQGSATAANAFQTVGVFVGDGNYAMPANALGKPIIRSRFTSTTQPAANVFKALTLTHSQTYRAGKYMLVGARVQQDTARTARMILQSNSSVRPGVVGVNNVKTPDIAVFRDGALGSWGEFSHTNVPQIEIFAQAADTAANGKYTLDVIQFE